MKHKYLTTTHEKFVQVKDSIQVRMNQDRMDQDNWVCVLS